MDNMLCKLDKALADTLRSMGSGKIKSRGIPTGIWKIDNMLGTLQHGNLYIIGARPGMGKSALAMQMAYNIANAGYTSLFVSLEMTNQQLITRLLSSCAGVKHIALRDGICNNSEWAKVNAVADRIKGLPLYLTDQSGLNLNQIAGLIDQVKPHILFVDYMGLIQPFQYEDRRIEIDKISYALKAIAKDYNMPVVCLSQLRRGAIGADDNKRPVLSDLRDSGAIEQAADAVILIHRQSLQAEKAEIHIAKNRHGETGVILADWRGEIMTFGFKQ